MTGVGRLFCGMEDVGEMRGFEKNGGICKRCERK